MATGDDSRGLIRYRSAQWAETHAELRSDELLLADAKRGHGEAFAELVNRYRRITFRIAYQMVGDYEEAVDISQEAFARTFTALDRMDAKRGFRSWICRVVLNLSVDFLRRKRHAASRLIDAELSEATTPSPEARVEQTWLQDRVRKALDMLPPKYRGILILREMEGMSPKHLARVLRCPEATARWRVHRARVLFKRIWVLQNGCEFP